MNMKIAICDDVTLCRYSILKKCQDYADKHTCNFEFVEFSTGEELLEYPEEIDLVFLDIELPGKNGLEVKDQLETSDKIGYIIFTTSHQQAIYKAFGRKTIGYMLKPIDDIQLNHLLDKVVGERDNSTSIEILDENKPISISIKSMICIKSDNIYTQVTTTQKSYIVRKSLNEWEKDLKEFDFFRIHRTCLVNMRFIQSVNNDKVNLDNGLELNVSRSKLKELRETYNNYIRRKMC